MHVMKKGAIDMGLCQLLEKPWLYVIQYPPLRENKNYITYLNLGHLHLLKNQTEMLPSASFLDTICF